MYSDGAMFLLMVVVPPAILAALFGIASALGDLAYRPIRLRWLRH